MKWIMLISLVASLNLASQCSNTTSETSESSTVSTTDTTPEPIQPPTPSHKKLPAPSTNEVAVDKDCIDKSKIDKERPCPDLLEPICGCDGKNYSNSCDAQKKGVQKWTGGPCEE